MILVGLPASGKTTFYRERFAGTHDHVSNDLSPHNPASAEGYGEARRSADARRRRRPQRRQQQLVAESLGAGRSVVIDNTNPSIAVRARSGTIARRLSY